MDATVLPDKTTFFQREESGVTYRIPALLYLQSSRTILAFAEKRSTPKDVDAEYLVMRRGVVEEHSTEPKLKEIQPGYCYIKLCKGVSNGGDVSLEQQDVGGLLLQLEPIVLLETAQLPGYRTMNPCPVFEKESQTVLLFFICVRRSCTEGHQILSGKNAARLCCITSKDHGTSWSKLTDLTKEAIGEDLAHWATFAVGPGHGIQLENGRLIIPAYAYLKPSWCSCLRLFFFTKPHSFIFYSDDQGSSWHKGGMIKKLVTGECEVAELTCTDGACVLYCSARTACRRRAEAFSEDSGRVFQMSYLSKRLCEPPHGCQGSIVSFVPPEEYQEEGSRLQREKAALAEKDLMQKSSLSWIIYSHPTSKKRRVDLGVYLNKSPLTPAGWNRPWIINKGPSGYSDLVAIEGSSAFGCLFECGIQDAYEEIAFRSFTMEELMRGML